MSNYSNCCGARPLWSYTTLCGDCHEHAEFYTETENQD